MGAPKKWIKALLGLKKSNKSQSLEKDENSSGCSGYLWHQRKQSVDIDSGILENELNQNVVTEIEEPKDVNFQSVTDSASSPSTSLQVQNAAQLQQNAVEELAAIHIQSAFRGFLARQAFCALKGLVRLQALVRGHAVRKQTAMNLHCMQALARVQVHVQASNVHTALENQTAQEKFQHLEHETHDNEIEDGWCDSVGSVEEIQAKLLKRKEAAAKREKAMAYASAHRLQGCGQKLKPASVKPDKSSCGHDSPERWMAVHPWENCFLDVNLVDGNVQGKPSTVDSSSWSSKPVLRGSVEDATSWPNICSRSRSTPKERVTPADKQGNKRLSLPDSRQGVGAQPAKQPSRTTIKRTPSAPKPVKAKPKLNRNDI